MLPTIPIFPLLDVVVVVVVIVVVVVVVIIIHFLFFVHVVRFLNDILVCSRRAQGPDRNSEKTMYLTSLSKQMRKAIL